jgi:hypothetical protein
MSKGNTVKLSFESVFQADGDQTFFLVEFPIHPVFAEALKSPPKSPPKSPGCLGKMTSIPRVTQGKTQAKPLGRGYGRAGLMRKTGL